MNAMMVFYILGHVLRIEGVFMLLPALTGLIYQESNGLYFLYMALFLFFIGFLLSFKRPENTTIYLKEGCVITALSWIAMSYFGALPFYFTGEIPSLLDAIFETVSGFTTTGASILPDPEALCHATQFWRCFTHWIGGMGVLVFLLAIIPMSGGSNINIMRAESPGPSVGKLVPKMRQTAGLLYLIYFFLTALEVLFLVIGKMPLFDSICTSFATAGTGGFGVYRDSMASQTAYLQWVVTIFMILFGVNFNFYFFLLYRHFKKAFTMSEIRAYLAIIVASVTIITVNTINIFGNVLTGVRHSAFQVASIMTTTGFASHDFDMWPEPSKVILVILMFIGACAGSTGGGIKVSRFIILHKSIRKEMKSYLHPKSVSKLTMDGSPIEHDVVRSVNVYFISFMILFTASVFFVSFDNKGLITSFSAVAATINNIGPGLHLVGPTQNYAGFSDFAKIVLSFDMLAGRLELFPLLMLFNPKLYFSKPIFSRKAN
ncbi:MAG: TrkH family potassium uptake protein [Clostridiales bacterium]|nr:TrkH family potassium uptake protein [Clostridiales bacterium]